MPMRSPGCCTRPRHRILLCFLSPSQCHPSTLLHTWPLPVHASLRSAFSHVQEQDTLYGFLRPTRQTTTHGDLDTHIYYLPVPQLRSRMWLQGARTRVSAAVSFWRFEGGSPHLLGWDVGGSPCGCRTEIPVSSWESPHLTNQPSPGLQCDTSGSLHTPQRPPLLPQPSSHLPPR